MMKKQYIVLLATALTMYITACSQNQKQNNQNETIDMTTIKNEKYDDLINPDPDMPHLSTANYMDTLAPLVHGYGVEPLYYLFVNNDMCVYQVLVNDILEYSNFEYEKVITPLRMNTCILKSGKQQLTIQVYPIGKLLDTDYTTFPDYTSLSLTLYCRNFRTGYTEEKVVLDYKSPTVKNEKHRDIFEATGKDYYEINLEFEAEVPYVHKGWTDGQDLRQLNQKKLEKEVLRFFHKQWLIYKDRDWKAWYSYLYQKELEVTTSLYYGQDDLLERIERSKAILAYKGFEIQPMGDCALKLYGYGRVARLEQANLDPFYRGEGSIVAEYLDDMGEKNFLFQNIDIYLPKGRELKAENFVIIR